MEPSAHFMMCETCGDHASLHFANGEQVICYSREGARAALEEAQSLGFVPAEEVPNLLQQINDSPLSEQTPPKYGYTWPQAEVEFAMDDVPDMVDPFLPPEEVNIGGRTVRVFHLAPALYQ